MLSLGKKVLLTMGALALSSPLLANSKSLFINGVNAAVYGDISADQGEWRNQESFSATRVKAGLQLIRIGFVGVTVGYQKVGFYTGLKNWTKSDDNRTYFDYRGPVGELHLFPEALFSFSLAYHQGKGFSTLKAKNVADFGITCKADDAACPLIRLEQSELKINELTAQVNYMFSPGLQFFLGAGTRKVTGTPYYEVYRQATVVEDKETKKINQMSFESYDAAQWKLNNQFFLLGIRGSTL